MIQQNRSILRIVFWCAIAVAFSCVAIANAGDNTGAPPWMKATSENPTGSYRYTVNGWEDTVNWRIEGEESKVKFIDHVHPVVWMFVVVLSASGLAVLASDEESVRRLWSK